MVHCWGSGVEGPYLVRGFIVGPILRRQKMSSKRENKHIHVLSFTPPFLSSSSSCSSFSPISLFVETELYYVAQTELKRSWNDGFVSAPHWVLTISS